MGFSGKKYYGLEYIYDIWYIQCQNFEMNKKNDYNIYLKISIEYLI